MPVYEVLLSKAARKYLDALPGFIHNKIIEDITHLSSVPRPVGCKKLHLQSVFPLIRMVLNGLTN